jgi:hypothetical protein
MAPGRKSWQNGCMRRRYVLVAALAGCTLLAVPANAAKPSSGGGGSSTLAFKPGVRLLTSGLPYGLVQGEPSIRVDTAGRMYVAAPASNVIGCEFWTLPDYRDLSRQRFTPSPDQGVGGGDCDLAVSNTIPAGQQFATVSYSSLYLGNLIAQKSTDGGATFSAINPISSEVAGNDREWMAAGEGQTVYMTFHIPATNNIEVSKSTDGGASFHNTAIPSTPGVGQAIDLDHIGQALMNNELGAVVVDMHSTLSPKPVYTIFTAPDSTIENQGSGDGSTHTFNHDVFLASSYDGGVHWTDTLIYRGPVERTYDHIFPSLGIDSSGGFWAAWISDEEHVYVTHAPPLAAPRRGAPPNTTVGPWSAPKQVDTNGVTNEFPWIVGAGPGRADLVWYAGTSTDPTLLNNDTSNVWNARLAQLAWTSKGGVTVPAQTVVSAHPNHLGAICSTGVTCDPTTNGRGLLDFFQVAITPDGRAAVAWADDSDTSLGGAQIYVSVQCSGISATTGTALTSTC